MQKLGFSINKKNKLRMNFKKHCKVGEKNSWLTDGARFTESAYRNGNKVGKRVQQACMAFLRQV